MAKIELILPAMGEGIKDATITRWLKKVGDTVREDESVVEVATDKVDSEVPSPAEGVLTEIFFKQGDAPAVGSVLAIISSSKAEELNIESQNQPVETQLHEEFKTVAQSFLKKNDDDTKSTSSQTATGKFISPLVRSIARKENISNEELDNILGTGKENRITKDDLLGYIRNRNDNKFEMLAEKIPVIEPLKSIPHETTAKEMVQAAAGDRIIEMDRMRKLIASHMLHSKQTSPHVTSFVEIDVTCLVNWRQKAKDDFLKRENEKLTFTPVFVEAAAKALKDFPLVNVSVDDEKIIVKKNINIGIATALPSGNLIVPVIKNADYKNLAGLAISVNDLASRARTNKLLPAEITGGTFTITNFGTFGNLTGTPIINQPEVAILGVGAIIKKPAVVETPQGDFIAVRNIMMLSLSYDHRVVDGALGGMFLRRIGDYLENWDKDRKI